ncbi:MAG: cation:proton antiporter [Opitutaceae bacterium]|jgi:CPA2 family monovalent cation:H+ antiporter-2
MEAIQFIQDMAVILAVAGVVGWVCQRLGLSTVVGYLVAGVVVGPHTPPFALVTDVPRVETLAQLGLIFLMFSIGMRLSVRKLQRLGFTLLIAVSASAGIIFALTRLLGVACGLSSIETLFLAGMLMVSSSAIISKVLADCGATHERSGQLAMGVFVLEDVVAVVMLTLLNSIVQFGEAGRAAQIGQTIGMLGAFIVLAGIAGMILVPWLLRRMSISVDDELQTLGLGGLLFGLALLAQKAGYSTALGAFLLGTIVAETPQRAQVERIFEGMKGIFTAVFFVAIGMQIDPRALAGVAVPVIGLSVFTIIVRTVACSIGLTLIGTPVKDALRTGLMVLPIGEFSFIIAQLGVDSGVIPAHYYPLVVGLSLVTTLAAPVVTRRSDFLAATIIRSYPRWFAAWLETYRGWLDRLALQQKKNVLWQLSRKRFIQIGVGMLFVTGLLLFSERLFAVVVGAVGKDWLFPNGPEILFWMALTLVASIPLFAIWRNLGAMALLYAEVSSRGHSKEGKLRPFIEQGLRILSGAGMFVWLATILPVEGAAKWLLPFIGLVAVTVFLFLRRKLIYWHSEAEVEIQEMLSPARPAMSATAAPWLQSNDEWNLAVIDCVIPDLADCRGSSIKDLRLRSLFGSTVVGIERQGYMISLPTPETVLYPRDKVLLMGTSEQVRSGAGFLQTVTGAGSEDDRFEEVRMEKILLDRGAAATGQSLGLVAPAKRFGVQVAGIHRGGMRLLNPSASEVLVPGDEMLVLGAPAQILAFRQWLREPVPEGLK